MAGSQGEGRAALPAIRRAVAPPRAGRRERSRDRASAARQGRDRCRQAAGVDQGKRRPRRIRRSARAHAGRPQGRSRARPHLSAGRRQVSASPSQGRFSALLLEGLDHYRKGKMMEAVRAWEEAYLLEPSNLRAREFLRSALERIHSHMAPGENPPPPPADGHPWLGDVPTTPKSPPPRQPPPPPASYPP